MRIDGYEHLRVALWLARIANTELGKHRLLTDALTFSAWYSVIGEMLAWPEAVEKIQKAQRAKKFSFEKTTALLERINSAYVASTKRDLAAAQRVLEGYEVHSWVYQNPELFEDLAKNLLHVQLGSVDKYPLLSNSNKFQELGLALGLSKLEQDLLVLAGICVVAPDLRSLFEMFTGTEKLGSTDLWCYTLGCTMEELVNVLSAQAPLRKAGFFKVNKSDEHLPLVSDFWGNLLHNELSTLTASLLEPLAPTAGAGLPARMTDEDQAMAVSILQNTQEKGVNLLLYGADGLEKRAMIQELLHKSNKRGFTMQPSVYNNWGDAATAVYVAQRLLNREHGNNAVLVVEKPSAVLEHKPSTFVQMLFGVKVEQGLTALDELLLDTNPAPCLWAGPGADSLTDDCIARFVFHAPLKKAGRAERRVQLERYVADLELSSETKEKLLSLEQVSARQVQTALRAAKLSGAGDATAQEQQFLQAIKRSLGAMARETAPTAKECVTQYSLDYVNCVGKFGPKQILKALQLRPKGSLCLYGPPGTGKTQFVEHLAHTLGKPLMVRRASDLLSKWVGESEKNIAAMFQDAEAEEAIAFLDEGDSFLQNRQNAQASWEVTKVNELLQHMERFSGIFVVATNLFEGLDSAALRRFTFKLEFLPLSPEQRWSMFVQESGLEEVSLGEQEVDAWKERLVFMPQLCAGDFATVKRQVLLLDESLTPEQWMEQLELECKFKSKAHTESRIRMA